MVCALRLLPRSVDLATLFLAPVLSKLQEGNGPIQEEEKRRRKKF
jgi:hypothetical protein